MGCLRELNEVSQGVKIKFAGSASGPVCVCVRKCSNSWARVADRLFGEYSPTSPHHYVLGPANPMGMLVYGQDFYVSRTGRLFWEY